MLLKSEYFEAKVPIRVKSSREQSTGARKPPLRDTSQEQSRGRSGDPIPSPMTGLAPDLGLLRDRLGELQEQVFAKDRGLAEAGHQLRDARLELDDARRSVVALERELVAYRRQETYLDQVRAIVRQAKPAVHELVELALKEEKAKVQEKYEQMMDLLAEKERSLNASHELPKDKKEYRSILNDESNNSQIFDLRNYIVKLEGSLAGKDKKIQALEQEICQLKNGIEAKDDEMIEVSSKAQLRDASKRLKIEETKNQKLTEEFNLITSRLAETIELANKATELVGSSFKGKTC